MFKNQISPKNLDVYLALNYQIWQYLVQIGPVFNTRYDY